MLTANQRIWVLISVLLIVAAAGLAVFLVFVRGVPSHVDSLDVLEEGAAGTDGGEEAGAALSGRGVARNAQRTDSERAGRVIPENAVLILGRVIDERAEPVAAARVHPIGLAAAVGEVSTGPDGRFQAIVPLGPAPHPWRVTLIARAGGGLVALRGVILFGRRNAVGTADPRIDVGDIVLESGSSISVRVSARGTAADTATLCIMGAPASGAPCLERSVPLGEEVLVPLLPRGSYVVSATADGAGRATAEVFLPRAKEELIELRLMRERRLTLSVLSAADGEPITGASIDLRESVMWNSGRSVFPYVPGQEIPLTDASGGTVVRGLSEGVALVVRARAPGYGSMTLIDGSVEWATIPPDATEATLRLNPLTAVHWPLDSGATRQPIDGTMLRVLEPAAVAGVLPESAVVTDRHVTVAGLDPTPLQRRGISELIVVTSDGMVARLPLPSSGTTGDVVSFSRAKVVRVSLVYEDGGAAAGVSLRALVGSYEPNGGRRLTNADGLAVFSGLPSGRGDVYVMPRDVDLPYPWSGARLATFDLDDDDVHLRCTVPVPVQLRLHLQCGWNPSLTSKASILLNGVPVRAEEESGCPGCYLVTWGPWPGSRVVRLGVRCRGCLPVSTVLDAGLGSSHALRLDLQPAGEIQLTLIRGRDERASLRLQRWDVSHGRWLRGEEDSLLMGRFMRVFPGPGGVVLVQPLPPGRYRIVDSNSQLATEAIDLLAGSNRVEVTLDLRGQGAISGVVIDPSGNPVVGALVEALNPLRDGDVSADPVACARTDRLGRFVLTGDVDHEVELVASHETLGETAPAERLRVRPGTTDVEILIGEALGGRLRLSLRSPSAASTPLPAVGRVILVDPSTGATVWEDLVRFDGAVARMRGFVSGVYDVYLDAPPFAPAVLRSVEISTTDADLGTARLERGGEIEVTVRGETVTEARLEVVAVHKGVPEYERRTCGRTPRVVLSGLGSGTFLVQAQIVGRPETKRIVKMDLRDQDLASFVLDLDR